MSTVSTTYAMPLGGGISGGKISLTGTSAFIDAVQSSARFIADHLETTGPSGVATFEATNIIYGTLAVAGWLVQGQKAGFASGDFATGTAIAVTFTLDTGRTVSGSILLIESDARWRRGRARIPISFFGKFTGAITEA